MKHVKKKVKTSIKALKSKHQSLLNREFTHYPPIVNEEGETEFRVEIGLSDWKCVAEIIKEEREAISEYLKSLGLPFDLEKEYEYKINHDDKYILIDEKKYDITKNPTKEIESGIKREKSVIGFILDDCFSHFPAIFEISNFLRYSHLMFVNRHRGDTDTAIMFALLAMKEARAITIAKLERYYLAEKSRNKATVATDKFIVEKWLELKLETGGISANSAAAIIEEELKSSSLKSIEYSTIRNKLKGKSLASLIEKYGLNPKV